MFSRNEEEKVMGVRIQKVKSTINKILKDCVNELPEIQFGWSGSVIEVYLSGGNYQTRNVIESHFANSKKYRNVTISNNDIEKHISFTLA